MRLNDRTSRVAGAGWLRLYPRAWRERYEAEMLAVLEARPVDWRTRVDPFNGVWETDVVPLLERDDAGALEATTILAELGRRPGGCRAAA